MYGERPIIIRIAWGIVFCLMLLPVSCQKQSDGQLDPNRLKIEVTEDGFVTLTLADLQATGLAINQLAYDNLHLSSGETAVSYTIHNNTLRFFGEAPTNRYTPTRVYVLEIGKQGVIEDNPDSPLPDKTQTIHFEESHLYESRARSAANDVVWFWHKLQPNNSTAIDFELPSLTNSPGEITINLFGLSSNPETVPDHDVEIAINNQYLATIKWDGATTHSETLPMPQSLLRIGQNTISFNNPADENPVDVMLLESFDVTFTPTLHIPLTQTPVNIELMRNPSWLESISGADFVIVTTDELVTAVSPLKTHRESQGLKTAIVSIEDLYDTFSDGHTTPTAIQSLLKYAVENWTPFPKYVLLIGDATIDHHGYANNPPMQHIPSFIVPVTFGGETISDASLADFDENGRFDLALGRWPVSTQQEITNLVQRTIAYETQTNFTNATLIVDPAEPSFAQMGARLGENGRFTHLNPTPLHFNPTSWFTVYIGHGSLAQWGKTSILHQDNLPAHMPPIILQFTCLTGLFAHPTQPALSETMLHHPNGPIAIVAATSLTLSHHQEPFAQALIEALQKAQTTRIGEAFLHAQQSLNTTDNPAKQDIQNTFILLGDPTIPIQRP